MRNWQITNTRGLQRHVAQGIRREALRTGLRPPSKVLLGTSEAGDYVEGSLVIVDREDFSRRDRFHLRILLAYVNGMGPDEAEEFALV